MLRHTRIDTTQTCARIRPAQLKRAAEFYVGFYEGKAVDLLANCAWQRPSVFDELLNVPQTRNVKHQRERVSVATTVSPIRSTSYKAI